MQTLEPEELKPDGVSDATGSATLQPTVARETKTAGGRRGL